MFWSRRRRGTLMATSTERMDRLDQQLRTIAELNIEVARRFAPVASMMREAHYSTDPTRVNHCVFCGSGALVARSDGGVDCNLCQRSFTVMEQPMYSNMPSTEQGAGINVTPNDPLMNEPGFEAPPGQPGVAPPAQPGDSTGDGEVEADIAEPVEVIEDEPEEEPLMLLRSRSGVLLDEDDFVMHHAIRISRGS